MDQVIEPSGRVVPLSVNWFPHRKCNYKCGFCFHTDTSSETVPLSDAKRGLDLLASAGMKKINISGGEPFLRPKYLRQVIQYCTEELKLESTGIICNGSKVTEAWIREYGRFLDILGVSCDSFDEDTNIAIGRSADGKAHTPKVRQVAEWCRDANPPIMFKLNSVVNRLNWEEDMNDSVEEIQPFRWKVFKVLLLDGENTGPDTNSLRDARELVITDEQFQAFLARHKAQQCLVPEDNAAMANSYLLLDEKMRFLNCKDGKKVPGRSILEVDVEAALQDAGWEAETFVERGGIFPWQKDGSTLDW